MDSVKSEIIYYVRRRSPNSLCLILLKFINIYEKSSVQLNMMNLIIIVMTIIIILLFARQYGECTLMKLHEIPQQEHVIINFNMFPKQNVSC